MRIALREAEEAADHGDVPVGCVVVRDGQVVGAAHNEREERGDPTAHAEILALRAAAQKVGAAGTVVDPLRDPRLLHRVEVQGGVLAAEALSLLRSFFDDLR